MPERSLPERVEDLERKLEELLRAERAEEERTTGGAQILDRDSGTTPRQKQAEKPGIIRQQAEGAAGTARGVASRVGELASGGVVSRGAINAALKRAGPAGAAIAGGVAVAKALPTAVEALAQVTGIEGGSELATALQETLPPQKLEAEVAGARAAIGAAKAFGRAGVSLSPQQALEIQERQSDLAEREASVRRIRETGANVRAIRAVGQGLFEGVRQAGDEAAAGAAGEGFVDVSVDTDVERAGGEIGGLIGQEERGRAAGRAVEEALADEVTERVLQTLDPFGFRDKLSPGSSGADRPPPAEELEERRRRGQTGGR